MKKALLLLLCFISVSLSAKTFYLSPTGNDENTGTFNEPFLTLNKAWTVIEAGDTVLLRGGTYYFTTTQFLTGINGTETKIIRIWAYPGEKPVITKSDDFTYRQNSGIYFSGNFFHWKEVEITGFVQYSTEINTGFKVQYANNNIFELIDSNHNGHGMIIARDCDDNQVLNCDFHHNSDPLTAIPYENADGLEICYIPEGMINIVKGCRFWWNSDDGIDLWENDGSVIIDSCWSWNNGFLPDNFNPAGNGVGFKLGQSDLESGSTVRRKLSHCIAYNNRSWGFHQNGVNSVIELFNNTACYNGAFGYCMESYNNQHVVKNNISYHNKACVSLSSASIVMNNTFLKDNTTNPVFSVSDEDFVSVDGVQLANPRQPDGNLPNIDFMHLATGSTLIDAGINVGYYYYGVAPDIGAFEVITGESHLNQVPVVSIYSPIKGESYASPATFTVDVNAYDTDGAISKVELFNGTEKLMEMTAAPFSFMLKDLPAGNYKLQAIATDNQQAFAASGILEVSVVAYKESKDYFNLYPNPNNGRFTVDFSSLVEAESFRFTVMDLIGNTVYSEEIPTTDTTMQFDLSYLNSGIYVLMIAGSQILLTQKLIKN